MARDYYGLLGVSRNASDARDQARLSQAGARTASRRQPRRGRAGEIQGDQRRLRGAERSGEASHRRPGRGSAGKRRSRRAAGSATSAVWATSSRRSSAAGSAAAVRGRGPIGRVRPGSDSLLRMRLDLEECAIGVTKQVTVDTAVLCDRCQGKGTNGDSAPVPLRHLRRPR